MRVVMRGFFAAAALAALAATLLILVGDHAAVLRAGPVAASGVVVMAIVGVGAVLEEELKRNRAVLIDIRDRLRR